MKNLFKLNHLFLATWLFLLYSAITHAADLTFTPAVPIVEINQTIVLSVRVKWITGEGQIRGDGPQVTYLAPPQAGLDVVTVLDSAGNVATVKIVITPFAMVSAENAQWEVFSNLDAMQQIARVKGSNTFLAATTGGLAQYEMATGELKRIFTTEDGLPDNQVVRFLADQGGVWIGTANGLAYYSNSTQKLTRYETSLGVVNELIFDQNGGLWVSLYTNTADILAINEGKKGFSFGEVAHLDANQQLTEYPLDTVAMQLVDDGHGGVWTLTPDGVNKEDEPWVLRHLLGNGEWVIYTAKALGLPGGFDLWRPEPDGEGGLWVGMKGYIVHFSLASEWRIYSAKEAGFSEEQTATIIIPLYLNKDGTLRVELNDESLFDLSEEGTWTPVTIDRPEGLFWSADDGFDGLWAMTRDRHLWHRDTDYNWTAYPDTSNYPYSARSLGDTPDGEGGAWVATAGDGLVHLTKDGQWEKSSTSSTLPLTAIYAIGYDAKGGGWILGTQFSYLFDGSGLLHTATLIRCKPGNSELVCDPPEPNLPPQITSANSKVPKLLADDKGGLWLGRGRIILPKPRGTMDHLRYH